MREIVEDCLNKAENRGLTSISFPAIGTGKLGFPKDLAASVMIGEVLAFKKQSMRLKKVAIVLHPKDRETIQVETGIFHIEVHTYINQMWLVLLTVDVDVFTCRFLIKN